MTEVERLCAGRTDIWLSAAATDALASYGKKHQTLVKQMMKRLERFSAQGFEGSTGDDKAIRHERNGVFRIGHPTDLFRLIGFFDEGFRHFIALDGFLKRGQSLSTAQQNRVNAIALIREKRLWKRRGDCNGNYPRLA